jgi:hypothetical protein
MSAKKVKFSVDARDRMLHGIDTLTHAVRVTLGPKGRNVLLDNRAVDRTRLALQHVRPQMDNIIAGAVMRAPHADAVASHRFAAGRMVRLSRAIPLRNAAAGNYEVLAQLPERDGDLQYRIKSDREPYQRIVKEGELETA